MNLKKIHPIAHTIARYFLASVILMYAVAKIMGTQFSSQPSVFDKTIGELSGFELTWFYYGYSFWYGVFIASSQILAAFLLFFRKTTRIGICIYLSIMINILVLDFAYQIDAAIGMAIVLTVVATFVLLSEFQAYYDFFIQKPPLFENEDRPSWLNRFSRVKFVYIPLLIIGLFALTYTLKEKIMTQNEFFGAWKPQSYQNWERIYFQSAHTFSIRNDDHFTPIYSGKYELDRENKEIKFLAFQKDYEETDILNPDTTKMYILMKAKYVFEANNLILSNDTLSLKSIRLK